MPPHQIGSRILAVFALSLWMASCAGDAPEVDARLATVPLYDDLGNYHREISSSEPLVQEYFDQGIRLYYAFNHQEAIRAFREAQRLDPSCAICWWGEALSWGPNINLPMDSASAVAAYAAAQLALNVRNEAPERERALIDALAVRYAAIPSADRSELDQAYAEAMAELANRYPDDDDIATLTAESSMDLRPWDYWTAEGEPQPGIAEALNLLEGVLERSPDHPGACHFFIHAVEKVYPERAVPCAERLAALMPGAGHLVHMPGHVYVRVGRYLDAVEANEHAIHADETYIMDQNPQLGMYTAGYYPHNYDFLAFAAMMIGRSDQALSAADNLTGHLPEESLGAPGMDFLQHWLTRPLQVQVRFMQWDDILSAPEPPESLLYTRGLWHYARGRAYAAGGNATQATVELEELRAIQDNPGLEGLRMEYNEAADLLGIAERVLTGWSEAEADRFDAAVTAMQEAVGREDALLYGEPPEWSVPTRQDLGALLLLADRPVDAEAAFRDDLATFPENGWSLNGLATALRRQGRTDEAGEVDDEFRRVWDTADTDPPVYPGP